MNIHDLYNKIKFNEEIDFGKVDVKELLATRAQIASLLVFIYEFKSDAYPEFIETLDDDYSCIVKCLTDIYSDSSVNSGFYLELYKNIYKNKSIGRESLARFINDFTDGIIDDWESTIFLALVYIYGISDDDTISLTSAMVDSGDIFDYRENNQLENKKIIRRYPTGGVSEKVALILPSLLASTAKEYPLASTFLVAKSLGFTGGTWDKISSIKGFTFPSHGENTVNVLNNCAVSMTVTHENVCPADRKMYQLRSATGTVESIELAVASIASKQKAVPADMLLLDVRTGSGAFFSDMNSAENLGVKIKNILDASSIKTVVNITDMVQPDGASVGNFLEVEEAFALLGCPSMVSWNSDGLLYQRGLVLKFYGQMLNEIYPEKSESEWVEYADQLILSGECLSGLKGILLTHGVNIDLAEKIISQGFLSASNFILNPIVSIKSPVDGFYKSINQRELGTIINFELGAGGNQFCNQFNNCAGAVIYPRLGDHLCEGDTILEIYSSSNIEDKIKLTDRLQKCFVVE